MLIARRYQLTISKMFLGPIPMTASSLLLVIICIFIAVATNSLVRSGQLQAWQTDKEAHFIDGAPSFSTADAPFFLRYSRMNNSLSDNASMGSVRLFPNRVDQAKDKDKRSSVFDKPLISLILYESSEDDEISTLLTTANQMIIITAAATAVMITICFGAAGYWAEGAVAAIGGGLSSAYLVRSSIGRIDTDQLNLGFMYLIFGLVIFAGRAKSKATAVGWCVVAGLAASIFMWWYAKPELVVIAAVSLAWILGCLQRHIPTVFIGTGLFLLISGITFFNPFTSGYFKDVISYANLVFPNTLNTITEVQPATFSQILSRSAGSVDVGIFCLLGLGLFLIRHPAIAIALGPLIAFSLLNFVIGNRAMFYSAPIMWFGAAFLITAIARFVAFHISVKRNAVEWDQAATFFAACVAMLLAWYNSASNYVPQPSFPKPVLEGLTYLKTSVNPKNSVVATWWDYGYASMLFNDLPTFHDGGSQSTPSTYFVAKALLYPNQNFTIGNLKYLSTEGHLGIAQETSLASLNQKFNQAVNTPSPDLYLVLTSQMTGWMSSISKIANWDIELGKPVTLEGNPKDNSVSYNRLKCRLDGYPTKLKCFTRTFDLERGLVNDVAALSAWAHSQNGKLLRKKSFDNEGQLALQIVQTGNKVNFLLMHRQLFESSFNKLFYLGQTDHPSISLHYDNYPHIRIYKIDGEPKG